MSRRPPPPDKKPKDNTNTPSHKPQQTPSQNASSSSRPPTRSRAEEEERRIFHEQLLKNKDSCSICLEEFLDNYLAHLHCGHKTCAECLTDMFKGSITDESRYPPKCCHPIPLAPVRPFIHKKVVEEFERKMVEWETQNRTYCSDPKCGAFIHGNLVNGTWASCPRCVRLTCTLCKGVVHGERPCPEDEATQQALGLMEKEGYKRCMQCQNGVELMHGCNHITCVCGHQFCYICGVRWKTCSCPGYGNPAGAHIDMDGTYHPAGERVPREIRPDNLAGWPEAQARRRQQGHGQAPGADIVGWPEAQDPRQNIVGWPEAQARRRDADRIEARQRENDTRRQQIQGRRDETLAAFENLNLFPERRALQQPAPQPQMQYRPQQLPRAGPLDMLPPPHQWPQPMGNPRNPAPMPFYGGPAPPGQPWVQYGQPGLARQDLRPPNPGNFQGRAPCDRTTGWCGCGGFHDAHNPPNPGWDRRR